MEKLGTAKPSLRRKCPIWSRDNYNIFSDTKSLFKPRAKVVHKHPMILRNGGDFLFCQILSRCTSLKSLIYDCHTLITQLCSIFDEQRYPHIKKLELHMNFCWKDSRYIKNAFTGLTQLTIFIKNIGRRSTLMFDPLMRIETLETLQIIVPPDELKDIWNSATFSTFMPKMAVTYGASISDHAIDPMIVVNNFPQTSSRKVTYTAGTRNRCGCITRINEGIFTILNFGFLLNFMFGLAHSPDESIRLNNLKSLSLSNFGGGELAFFQNIELAAPLLQSLKLSNFYFVVNKNNPSAGINLPYEYLKSLELIDTLQRLVVTREEYDTRIRSWYYCDKSNRTVEIEGDNITPKIKQSQDDQYLIILKSNTLEHVCIRKKEDY
ncbi:hypothetical protein BDB01DRAFT_898238 [Pilobolus umbonatus]|nr:hypothetical protein BDB01DRAFT_898238 [Pilobolus umbonatus]